MLGHGAKLLQSGRQVPRSFVDNQFRLHSLILQPVCSVVNNELISATCYTQKPPFRGLFKTCFVASLNNST